jgi:hypothetical protein
VISENDEILDDLLSRWDDWAQGERTAVGYYSSSPTFKQYRASRQYDWESGVMDDDHEAARMEAVNACVERIPQPYKTALHFNARNLRTGAAVWRSPRLPENDIERAHIVAEARDMLMLALISDGVM